MTALIRRSSSRYAQRRYVSFAHQGLIFRQGSFRYSDFLTVDEFTSLPRTAACQDAANFHHTASAAHLSRKPAKRACFRTVLILKAPINFSFLKMFLISALNSCSSHLYTNHCRLPCLQPCAITVIALFGVYLYGPQMLNKINKVRALFGSDCHFNLTINLITFKKWAQTHLGNR